MYCKYCVFITAPNGNNKSEKNKICCSNNKLEKKYDISPSDKMCSLGIIKSSSRKELQEKFLEKRNKEIKLEALEKEKYLKNLRQIKNITVSIINEAKKLNIRYEINKDGIILLSLKAAFKDKWAVIVYEDSIHLYHKNQMGDLDSYHLQRKYNINDITKMLNYVINHKNISFNRKIIK